MSTNKMIIKQGLDFYEPPHGVMTTIITTAIINVLFPSFPVVQHIASAIQTCAAWTYVRHKIDDRISRAHKVFFRPFQRSLPLIFSQGVDRVVLHHRSSGQLQHIPQPWVASDYALLNYPLLCSLLLFPTDVCSTDPFAHVHPSITYCRSRLIIRYTQHAVVQCPRQLALVL